MVQWSKVVSMSTKGWGSQSGNADWLLRASVAGAYVNLGAKAFNNDIMRNQVMYRRH